ncbi:hypothetical protein CFC21_021506 [Triticum aestivum]|uniref:Uncharacterized protein n=2 Tax=Triticum aestivum TaxID=4565 RepID=A0A3B6BZG6_WHEAT|nr:hypothetical protein CFC21_021506 [Triticum aestivum]
MEQGTNTAPAPLPQVAKETGHGIAVIAAGGSAFYFLKGLRNSPKGGRLAAAAQAVRTNASRIGGWGVWLGAQAAIDSALERVNKKDDRFNTMISCGAASALVSVLRGPRAAALSGIKGAVFGGLAEIAIRGLKRFEADLPEPEK